MIRATLLTTLLLGFAASQTDASIINNGSFESVPSGATGQGLLPSNWLDATTISPPADTYSNDGSYGLLPGDFGNFPGVIAFDGTRWVAGSAFGRLATSTTVGGEAFGNNLATTLTPGAAYQLDAQLYQAIRADLNNPGGYHVFLAADNTPSGLSGAVLLGAFAPTTGIGGWEARSLAFIAPADAGSRPFLVFAPYQTGGGNTYPGIDATSLGSTAAVVPEPTSGVCWLVGVAVIGLVGLRSGRQRSS